MQGQRDHLGTQGRTPGALLPAAAHKMAACQVTWPPALPDRREPGPPAFVLLGQEQPAGEAQQPQGLGPGTITVQTPEPM